MKKVYLAGPIVGLDYDGATEWRNYAIEKLRPLAGFSPMRAKPYLKHVKSFSHSADENDQAGSASHAMSSVRGIMARDHYDCITSDIILLNLLPARKPIIGSSMETAWAFDRHIPVVCVLPKNHFELSDPVVHGCVEHGMLQEAVKFRVDTLDEGIDICRTILLGPDA
jgi:nucleoside 2-deoxyribosyltransferase